VRVPVLDDRRLQEGFEREDRRPTGAASERPDGESVSLSDHHGQAGSPAMIEPGAAAPDLTLDNQDGESVSLSDHHGRWVVLNFYPKADTPGRNPHAARLTFG